MFDTLFLIQLNVSYLEYTWLYDLTVVSTLSCKIFMYINYTTDAFSPIFLVYISIDRLIALRNSANDSVLRTKRNQFIFSSFVVIYNCLLYSPIYLNAEIVNIGNQSINETIDNCQFSDSTSMTILVYLDTVNRVLIPFIFMTASNILLIIFIFSIGKRVRSNSTAAIQAKKLKKNIRVSISLIFLNLFYLILSLPISVSSFFSYSDFYFVLTFYLLYMAYATNFYIIVSFNSLFRKTFLKLLKLID